MGRLANFGTRYEDHTLQAKNGKDTPCTGDYKTATDALVDELQKQY